MLSEASFAAFISCSLLVVCRKSLSDRQSHLIASLRHNSSCLIYFFGSVLCLPAEALPIASPLQARGCVTFQAKVLGIGRPQCAATTFETRLLLSSSIATFPRHF